jgi:hypothetical protein
MPTQAAYPSTATDTTDEGISTWSNPSNAAGSNTGDTANCAMGGGFASNASTALELSGLGFTVPSGATISGITVDVLAEYASGDGAGYHMDLKLYHTGDSNYTSAIRQTVTTIGGDNSSTYTFGGANNTWGKTWSHSNINSSSFALRLLASRANTPAPATARIDTVYVTVTYTTGSADSMAIGTVTINGSATGAVAYNVLTLGGIVSTQNSSSITG